VSSTVAGLGYDHQRPRATDYSGGATSSGASFSQSWQQGGWSGATEQAPSSSQRSSVPFPSLTGQSEFSDVLQMLNSANNEFSDLSSMFPI
jgi:hypothetical protein